MLLFSFQKHHNLPINNNDVKLDYIITEKGIINENINFLVMSWEPQEEKLLKKNLSNLIKENKINF